MKLENFEGAGTGAGPIDVFLQPGDCFVGGPRHRIRTLLGSCVSITLWHPVRCIGAMSHFLLSSRSDESQPMDARYGADVLPMMLQELARRGVQPAECQAKLFGGGNMFPQHVAPGGPPTIGERNGDTARELLRRAGIEVVSESLFGIGHRQIVFEVASGDVWVRQIKPTDAAFPNPEAST